MMLLHPHCLCWAQCNWTLLPLPLCAACSAVDLIRLGGGRLRFLVAKSDLDVSEKISASSCWLPLWSDKGTMKDTGTDGWGPRKHTKCVWVLWNPAPAQRQSWEKMLCDSEIQSCFPHADSYWWRQREWQEEESPNWPVFEVRDLQQPECSAVCFKAQNVAFI